MYRLERAFAFVIDIVFMGILGFVFLALLDPTLQELLPHILAHTFLSEYVSFGLWFGYFYNIIWIYYLITGLILHGSIGKRILGLKIINTNGGLKTTDLLKRYSFLIAFGIFYTVLSTALINNPESVNLSTANFLLSLYHPVVLIYLIACNIGHKNSLYDHLAKLKIVKIKKLPRN